MMVNINYPEPGFRIKTDEEKDFIFDTLRKKWILLTPEEWVRQNFLQYLLQVKNYPASLIAIEKEIKLGELKKRFDMLVYDNNHQPWMMVECKAATIKLDDKVLEQILRYNISVPVRYLVVTNGSDCYAWSRSSGRLDLIEAIPDHCG
ncbi:MAG: type I restriction enzyme HsdR N-terminal domain-containing protein [Bacteroidota bacterium]|nr:type I restriction enzyme HsdR N-terminal domain-containing protein [Bacteroidota bacterium]